jgi:phage recombination protein Bet
LFGQICAEKQLSAFAKEVYLVKVSGKNGEKYHVITGINGFRKIAARTGQYAGCTDAKYNLRADGTFSTAAELAAKGVKPISCTISSYRFISGQKCEFTHTAVFSEFEGGMYTQWPTRPFQMIAKVAEAFAIRKGFGDETSGLLEESEIDAMQKVEAKTLPTSQISESDKLAQNLEKCLKEYFATLTKISDDEQHIISEHEVALSEVADIAELSEYFKKYVSNIPKIVTNTDAYKLAYVQLHSVRKAQLKIVELELSYELGENL